MANQDGDELDFELNIEKMWDGSIDLDTLEEIEKSSGSNEIFLDYLQERYREISANPNGSKNLISSLVEKIGSENGFELTGTNHNKVSKFFNTLSWTKSKEFPLEWVFSLYLTLVRLTDRRSFSYKSTKLMMRQKKGVKSGVFDNESDPPSLTQLRLFKLVRSPKYTLAESLAEVLGLDQLVEKAEFSKKLDQDRLTHIGQFLLDFGALIYEKTEKIDDDSLDDTLEKMGVLARWSWERHLFSRDCKRERPVSSLLKDPLHLREWCVFQSKLST